MDKTCSSDKIRGGMQHAITKGSCSCQAFTANKQLCHYVIVRADLPRGMASAQIVHAAGESVNGTVASGTYAIVLAAKDEDDLKQIHQHIIAKGLQHKQIVETHGIYANQLMAIGLVPIAKKIARRYLSSIPLLK